MKCVIISVPELLTTLWFTFVLVSPSSLLTREPQSIKGVCDAQCEAFCQDTPADRVDECETLCNPGTPRTWVLSCQTADDGGGEDCISTGYCSVLEKQSIPAVYIPPKPHVNSIRDPFTKSIMLHWKTDNQTAHKVVYIVQWVRNSHAVPSEDDWFTIGWTMMGVYLNINVKDACERPWFRVASVSRYGSQLYSLPVQTPALPVAVNPPGPVRHIYASPITFHADTDEISFTLKWMEPLGWERSDIISYFWDEHLDQPCLDSISGQKLPVYFDSQSSNAYHHTNVNEQTVRMPSDAVGCKFRFQVRGYSKCHPNIAGQIRSVLVNIDCHKIAGIKCSNVYNPPGNVRNITLLVIPNAVSPRVLMAWSPPTDLGSEGRVAQYHIRWGNLVYDQLLGIGYLYNTTTKVVPGNITFADITLGTAATNDSYGVQVIATAPGHDKVGPWVSPVQPMWPHNRSDPQNDWTQSQGPSLNTTILKDDNGLVIVLVPKAKGVRVYVTMPEERSKEDFQGFYLHWGRVHNSTNRVIMQGKNSAYIPKNYTRPYPQPSS